MALVLTIGGNDHTSELVHESLVVNQTNDGLNSTCSFDLVDTAVVREDVWTVGTTHITDDGDVITGHTAFSEPKVEVSVVDGATVYFAGILSRVNVVPMGVVAVRGTLEAETQILRCGCHDFSQLLEEFVIDSLEEYVNVTDEAVIDDIFTKYVTGIDFATHVDGGAFTFRSISFENITVRQALDLIVARTDYVWYMDHSKKLHYSELEANTPAWHLSDVPDQVSSFSYLDPIRRETDATNLVNRVFIVGAESANWYEDAASVAKYGTHRAIIRDARLYIDESIQARADTLLARLANPIETYLVKTYKDGLRAGVNLRVVCAYYDLDETLLINRLMIKFPVDCSPIYELTLGGLESSSGTAARRLTLDQINDPSPVAPGSLPIASRGWGHDLTFTATDHETVTWGGGTLTTAGGQTFTINAGNTDDPGAMAGKTIVYLDLIEDPTSPHDLQLTTDETAALGAYKIMIAVCWPGIVAAGDQPEVLAGFQVFGSTTEVATYLNATNIIANAITAQEIYCNTLAAISADMGTLTTGLINITRGAGFGRITLGSAGVAIYDAAANLRIYLNANDGTFEITTAAGGDRMELDTDGLRFYDGANLLIDLNAANATFSLKSGTAGNPRIEISNSEIAGYDGADTKQFYLSAADGVAYAGGGKVWMDEYGLTLSGEDFNTSAVKWDLAGVTLADIRAYLIGTEKWFYLRAPSPASTAHRTKIYLEANAPAGSEDCVLSLLSGRSGEEGWASFYLEGADRLKIEKDSVRAFDDLRVDDYVRIGKGLYVGSISDPNDNDIWCDGDIRVHGGIYVGQLAVNPDEDDIWCDGDVRIGRGLYVGGVGTNPPVDDIFVEGDIRILGGLYVGNLGVNPDQDDIVCDGTIAVGYGDHWKLGDYSAYVQEDTGFIDVNINGVGYRLLCRLP